MSSQPKQKTTVFEGAPSHVGTQLTNALVNPGQYVIKQLTLGVLRGEQIVCVCLWNKEDDDD